MERRFSNRIICFVTLVTQVSFYSFCYADSYLVYEVQSGDTLSSILYDHKALPIYGKNGSLNKTISINPFLYVQKGNYIVPHLKIKIPQREFDLKQTIKAKGSERSVSSVSTSPVKPQQTDLIPPFLSSPTIEEKHTDKTDFGSLIKVNPHVSFLGLNVTQINNGSKAILKSGLNYGLAFEWAKKWNDGLESYIKFDINKVNFDKPNNRELLNSSLNLSTIALGLNYVFEKYSLGFELSTDERVVLDAISITQLQLNKINSTNIVLIPGYKIIENDSGVLGLQGLLGYSAPASNSNTTAKSGFNTVGGKVMFSQNLEKMTVFAGFYVQNYKISTDLIDESLMEQGLEFRVVIPMGKSK